MDNRGCAPKRRLKAERLGKGKAGPPSAGFLECLAVGGERRSSVRAFHCERFEAEWKRKWKLCSWYDSRRMGGGELFCSS